MSLYKVILVCICFRDSKKQPTVTGPKKYLFFAYCEMFYIFTGPAHFLPVMALGDVVSLYCRMSGLHQAALMGHTEIMELLLENGALVNLKDNKGTIT